MLISDYNRAQKVKLEEIINSATSNPKLAEES